MNVAGKGQERDGEALLVVDSLSPTHLTSRIIIFCFSPSSFFIFWKNCSFVFSLNMEIGLLRSVAGN